MAVTTDATHSDTLEPNPVCDWLGLGSFDIIGSEDDRIPLNQVGDDKWELRPGTSLQYRKMTGLEKFVDRGDLDPALHQRVRTVTAEELGQIDLASVPQPMRWFSKAYGAHTPAAVFHDWLIPNEGQTAIIPEEYADRYFRYQLGSVGVPRLKRYIMWTAVAMRTRFKSADKWKPVSLVIWALLAVFGMTLFGAGAIDALSDGVSWFDNPAVPMAVAAVLPFVVSLLWTKQYAAGIVTAIAAPLILPTGLVAFIAFRAVRALDTLMTIVFGD